jgi:apolipoprotein N-acyltransferase
MILRFADALRSIVGWRRYVLAFSFGLISATAFPPLGLFPVLWFCFPALIFLLQGAPTLRAAFQTGWSFAFGLFLLGLYWIAAAMFVDIKQFWWAVPLAVAGLPAFLGIYYGVASLVAWRLGVKNLSGILIFALLWFATDLVRGHLLTGFPWNLEGYVWDPVLSMLQITSVIGIYGLTLLTLVSAFLMAGLALGTKASRVAVVLSLGVLLVCGAWGDWRLAHATNADTAIHIRIVQPNIDQAKKWREGDTDKNFQDILNLSTAPSQKPLQAIVWPETASTFFIAEDAIHRYQIARRLPEKTLLLTGVIRRDYDAAANFHYYNSLLGIDNAANIVAQYDKFHLVPFGEYVPMRGILPFKTLAALGMDFTPGSGLQTLTVPGLPSFSPLICYEAIFSGEVVDESHRPQFMLNVTNDGWYGKTAGPYQHFASVRVRAIEEGLPLLRSANTGISGVVDAYGRVRTHLGIGLSGAIDAVIPVALPPTLFSRYGAAAIFILMAIYLLAAISLCRAHQ